jgi:hypothetical protein
MEKTNKHTKTPEKHKQQNKQVAYTEQHWVGGWDPKSPTTSQSAHGKFTAATKLRTG